MAPRRNMVCGGRIVDLVRPWVTQSRRIIGNHLRTSAERLSGRYLRIFPYRTSPPRHSGGCLAPQRGRDVGRFRISASHEALSTRLLPQHRAFDVKAIYQFDGRYNGGVVGGNPISLGQNAENGRMLNIHMELRNRMLQKPQNRQTHLSS